ncbi:MAG: MFS transporter [Acetobacteraceae bacterium]|nr:MAG: MFS transporter [Acetobacteraceae bacterium]
MLGRYLALFIPLFLGWGVLSPFLPAVLAEHGASASQVGFLLGIGIGVRLLAMPLAGALADRYDAPRQVLAAVLLGAAVAALLYGLATGFALLLLVGILHAAATGPMGPLPDALTVHAAAAGAEGRGPRIDYGVVRGAGAAAFIAGSICVGLAVEQAGTPDIALWLNAGLFGLAAGAALLLPKPASQTSAQPARAATVPIRTVLAMPAFRRLLLVSGLIQGSHAFSLGFAVLGWQAAGLTPGTIGWLWSLSVMAEVLVFFLLGRRLLARLGPAGLCALAGAAGLLRWSMMALDTSVGIAVLAQPLHGLTYAGQHLAAMAILGRIAPDRLAMTAQALHASLGVGLAGALLMLISGPLYMEYGTGGFWVMAVLSAMAVPLALRLPVADSPAENAV